MLKKIIILGVKDAEGNYYACGGKSNRFKETMTKLSEKDYINASEIDVFPYKIHRMASSLPEGLIFAYLEVEMELTDSQYDTLIRINGNNKKYPWKKVKLIKELETPYRYGWMFFQEQLRNKDWFGIYSVHENMVAIHKHINFKNRDELGAFLCFYNYGTKDFGKINLSVLNFELWDELLITQELKNLDVYLGYGLEKKNYTKYFELINNWDDFTFLRFHEATTLCYLENTAKERLTKSFYSRIRHDLDWPLYHLMNYMSDEMLKDYGYDELLYELFPDLKFLLPENHIAPEHRYYDNMDEELSLIDKVLPHVSMKSYDFVKRMHIGFIRKYIPEIMKERLAAELNLPDNFFESL